MVWTIPVTFRNIQLAENSDHCYTQELTGASQVALVVKNLPARAGDLRDAGSVPGWGRFPGEGMATHSSVLAWRIQRSLVGYSPWAHQESHTTEQLSTEQHKL